MRTLRVPDACMGAGCRPEPFATQSVENGIPTRSAQGTNYPE